MLFSRRILLICAFLTYVSGYGTMDVIGFQIVNYRRNDTINDMSVVLRNIPRNSKMARLDFKKYSSTFFNKTVNVNYGEAVFENLEFNLHGDWTGRIMHSTVILQNNTKYEDKEVFTTVLIEYLNEDDKREKPHACLKSCRIIIDYHAAPSMEHNIKGTTDANPKQPKRSSVPAVSSTLTSANIETLPNLEMYPNTSIVYKPNSDHNVSCVADNSIHNYDLRLYQLNGNYVIRARTTNNVLKTVVHLTERDDGTSLQCFILWKYHSIPTKTIDLLMDKSPDVKPAQDETNAEVVAPSLNKESYWQSFSLATVIVVIILLLIIISMVIRTRRSKSQGFLRSNNVLPNSVNFMNLFNKYDTGLNDDTTRIQTNMELWKNNECYANETHYDVGVYYSYATNTNTNTNSIFTENCHSENQYSQ